MDTLDKDDLLAPDLGQCQAERPNCVNAFTLGGRSALVRCTNKPTMIATERMAGHDGKRGSMSVCDECAFQLVKQLGQSFATFQPIASEAV